MTPLEKYSRKWGMSFKKHFHGGININMVMAMMAMAMEMAMASSGATRKTGRTRPRRSLQSRLSNLSKFEEKI